MAEDPVPVVGGCLGMWVVRVLWYVVVLWLEFFGGFCGILGRWWFLVWFGFFLGRFWHFFVRVLGLK